MRNTTRIAREISALVNGVPGSGFRGFGRDAVFWTDGGDYLFFPRLLLPTGFHQRHSAVLVVIPDGYGYGVPLQDVYVEADLLLADGGRPSRLFELITAGLPPHAAGGADASLLAPSLHYQGRIPRLAYLCIHPTTDVTFDEYLEQIYVYLSNPAA